MVLGGLGGSGSTSICLRIANKSTWLTSTYNQTYNIQHIYAPDFTLAERPNGGSSSSSSSFLRNLLRPLSSIWNTYSSSSAIERPIKVPLMLHDAPGEERDRRSFSLFDPHCDGTIVTIDATVRGPDGCRETGQVVQRLMYSLFEEEEDKALLILVNKVDRRDAMTVGEVMQMLDLRAWNSQECRFKEDKNHRWGCWASIPSLPMGLQCLDRRRDSRRDGMVGPFCFGKEREKNCWLQNKKSVGEESGGGGYLFYWSVYTMQLEKKMQILSKR